jgi:YVTN family beta-propeller protein
LTNKIYVTTLTNTVSVIDGSTNMVVATVAAGLGPDGVAVDPVTNKIFVTDVGGGPATVTVIDGSSAAADRVIGNAVYCIS